MNINKIKNLVEEGGIIFLTYGGFLSQSLISGMTEALEKEAEYSKLHKGTANNIFTIFIELSQNMMNYSKHNAKNCTQVRAEGLIFVGREEKRGYFIHSQNIVSNNDKNTIEPKLKDIVSLDKDGIKQKYRQLRREGRDVHDKGAGIGFYEIAKRSNKIAYDFEETTNNKYYFNFRVYIKEKEEKDTK